MRVSVLLYYLFFLLLVVEERRTIVTMRTITTAATRSILDAENNAVEVVTTRIEGPAAAAAAARLPQPNEHHPTTPLPRRVVREVMAPAYWKQKKMQNMERHPTELIPSSLLSLTKYERSERSDD